MSMTTAAHGCSPGAVPVSTVSVTLEARQDTSKCVRFLEQEDIKRLSFGRPANFVCRMTGLVKVGLPDLQHGLSSHS